MARGPENAQIAALFAEMADLLAIHGTDPHRANAFRRASRVIENLPEPAPTMIARGTLEKRPGIGPGIVERVKQILKTGTCTDLTTLRASLPPGVRAMVEIKGVGPKTARRLYLELGVASVDDLEYAARTGQLERLPRMGDGTVQRILRGIEAYRARLGKATLHAARRLGNALVEAMAESPAASKVALAGSARRGEATVGDLDVLVASRDRAQIAARFVTLPEISEVLLQGDGRCSVRLHGGLQADLRVLAPEEFGAGLHYFTGSKLHNIAMRLRGTRRGLKVNDHGVFRRSDEHRFLPGETEEDIFAAVGLPFIPPELRENLGEIEAAEEGRLPELITEGDLQGDLHMHTRDSDGSGTAEEMIARAAALPGHRYIAITDHSKSLRIANGLDEARLLAQMKRLRSLEQSTGAVRVLCGVEVDILANGELDLDIELLRQLDWVVASVHQQLDLDAESMTRRVIRAMESGVVDCIGHPTGRRVGHRDPYPIDIDAVLHAARRIGVAVECNGGPNRMDLPDVACRQAREMGVPVVLNTDAHSPAHLGRREFAVAMARRGWLERKHVLNAQPWTAIADRRSERIRRHGVRVLEDLEPAAPVNAAAPTVEEDGNAGHAWMDVAEPVEAPTPLDLDRALAMRPLPAALRERLMRFLQQGDPELEAALARRPGHPMQQAFALLASPEE